MPLRKLLAPFALACIVLQAGPARAEDCSASWEVFSHQPFREIAFPDTSVRYWRLRFALPEGDALALRIKGDFPHARYMNFSVYDQKTSDSGASLSDYAILPDPGSSNPYLDGADRTDAARAYTAWLVPSAMRDALPNAIAFPEGGGAEAQRLVELWYRVYLPDSGRNDGGGVSLPKVEAFAVDADVAAADWRPVACPARATSVPPLWDAARNLPPRTDEPRFSFFAPAPSALYANPDNVYLAGRPSLGQGDVAVIRFRAPSFPATRDGSPVFDARTDVRYWSLCVGNMATLTAGCVADAAHPAKGDELVTVVLGPPAAAASARARGFAFLARTGVPNPVLIYRNLIGREDFAGNLRQVRRWQPGTSEPIDGFKAESYVGEFAPRGVICSVERFQRDACGVATATGN